MVSSQAASEWFVVNCILYSATAFQVYDWFCYLSFEVEHIWSKPASSLVKWQYLFSQYVGIVLQGATAIVHIRIESMTPMPIPLCRKWHAILTIAVPHLSLCLNVSLAHRLAALYRSARLYRGILGFIAVLIVADYLNTVYWGARLSQKLKLKGGCLVEGVPREGVYLFIMHLSVQAIIWALTLIKFERSNAPLASLVMRDGSLVFGALLALWTAILISNILRNPGFNVTPCAFPILTLLMACGNCHMIRNLESVGHCQREEMKSCYSTGIELTSIGIVSESDIG